MTRSEIKEKLELACKGELHKLTPAQRKAVGAIHVACVCQAFFIAVFFTGCVGVWENFLVYELETDGVRDAYWTCYCSDPECQSLPSEWESLQNRTGNCEPDAPGDDWGCFEPQLYQQDKPASAYCSSLPRTYEHDQDTFMLFWTLNIFGLLIGIAGEISLLILTTMRSAVKVSSAIDLRLVPLNADRANVAGMIIRSVFELPDPDVDLQGEEGPEGESASRSKFLDLLAVAVVKGKAMITSFLIKRVINMVTPYQTATWIKPYAGTMVATTLWDTLICHSIMRRVGIRAIGVTTAVEVFNEIFDLYCPEYEANPSTVSDIARVQILRAIAVSVVSSGEMFPTIELLLRHAINYFDMKKSAAVRDHGVIYHKADFLKDMKRLSQDERRAVLSVHMLCYVLDGTIDGSELSLWQEMLNRVEELYQEERKKDGDGPPRMTLYDSVTPRMLCQQFRANLPLSATSLSACFDPAEHDSFMEKSGSTCTFWVNDVLYLISSVLTKQV